MMSGGNMLQEMAFGAFTFRYHAVNALILRLKMIKIQFVGCTIRMQQGIPMDKPVTLMNVFALFFGKLRRAILQ